MKIGIGLPNQARDVRPARLPRWAAMAEEAGFSTLGTTGRIAYPGVMDTVALAAAAGATSRIGLMSAITVSTVWPATLFAKEVAGIDEISGGRLTLGIGAGIRPDNFVVDGLGPGSRGRRMDADLATYREVWGGAPVGGGTNPAVTSEARTIPLLFGGMSAPALARMARWGEGYIAGSVPPPMAEASFDQARTAWRDAGRQGEPWLVGIAYFALTDPGLGRRNLKDYYADTEFTDLVVGTLSDTPEAVRTVVKAFADIGADELILNSATDEIDDVHRLAELVL
ncbi:LLM class flavin-dependent oxidoreductase [Kribbella sp. NPDC004875]|uniref:LLM class flavin-dependent oxidoreductase n=1 Tax=Kribbella sp. NPDC004875 TaxID=3364107 RepID=UPI00367E5DCA